MPTIVTRPRRTVAEVTVVATYQPKIDIRALANEIYGRTSAGVNVVGRRAHDTAIRLVPIRKVFRYGRNRNGLRFQAHQEVRTLTFDEAQGEEKTRRRLGLPSAFSTNASGRRIRGDGPQVQTAQFPSGYQSRNRANDARSLERREFANIRGQNRLAHTEQTEIVVSLGRGKKGTRTVPSAPIPNLDAESDLSSEGRAELRLGRALSKKGEVTTLGGRLRQSVIDGYVPATPGRRFITAEISAGNKEVDYAKYVEFGTRRSKAQPFLRPALAQAREELLSTVKREIIKGG